MNRFCTNLCYIEARITRICERTYTENKPRILNIEDKILLKVHKYTKFYLIALVKLDVL